MTRESPLGRLYLAVKYIEDPRHECLANWDPLTGWWVIQKIGDQVYEANMSDLADAVADVRKKVEGCHVG